MRWVWVVVTVAWGPWGCIESQRAVAPPEDTVTADTAPDTHTPDSSEDTSVADTTVEDARPHDTRPDTVPTECVDASGCQQLALGPCEVADCVDGKCVANSGGDGLPCDDGDACTEGTTCEAGVCGRGQPLACPQPPSPCLEARCEPAHGCKTANLPALTPCDNGEGPAPGACTPLGWATADACDSAGVCVDQHRPTMSGSGTAEGTWYFVSSAMGAPVGAETVRGWMTIDDDGAVGLEGVTRTASGTPTLPSPWETTAAGGTAGWSCRNATGRVDLVLADGATFHGQHTPDAGAMAAVELHSRRLLVAVRPTGTVSETGGVYRFVSTSQGSSGPRTWFGEMSLEAGCVTAGGGAFVTWGGDVEAVWYVDGGGCFDEDAHGYAPLSLTLGIQAAGTGVTWSPIRWAGAIAPGGDVIVLTRDDGAQEPSYGTIVMVRESPLATGEGIGPATFVTTFHGAHTQTGPVTAAHGAFAVTGGGALSGWLESAAPPGAAPLNGVEAKRTPRGRYTHTLAIGPHQRIQSGWIDPANHFGFVFTASAGTSNLDLLESNIPLAPSLGFVVRTLGETVPPR